MKKKEVSYFLYKVFIEKFIPYEVDFANETKAKKEAVYTIENTAFLITVKKELESIISAQLQQSDYELLKRLIQQTKYLNRFISIQPSKVEFKAQATLIRFMILILYEILKTSK